jgi:glycerol kinase
MDLRTCSWHQPFLQLFQMQRSSLPRIVSNAEVYGSVREGPLAGVPIAGCLGDQQAALLGGWCRGPAAALGPGRAGLTQAWAAAAS